MDRIALGVDIGGTKVAAGLVNSTGRVLHHTRLPMNAQGSAEDGIACVHAAIREVFAANAGVNVCGIGVASPGPLKLPEGIVLETPNLHCWHNFPLGDHIRRTHGLPTFVDNDANAAGLAEALWGAGSGYKSVFYATIGTGIGTAIVLDKHVYYGRTGEAAEGGHMTIDYRSECQCGCGKRGCLEGVASGPAIARRARERVLAGEASIMASAPDSITAKTVEQAWRGGDALAAKILEETADLLSIWLGNIVDLLEPDVIVVGGGVGQLVSEWFAYIRERLPSWSINTRCQEIPLVTAKYGIDAGVAGAAALCFTETAAIGTGV